ncbi:MAG: hypothetical protein A2039_03190 [Candidatus Melainabacteria bacterium GWA2_34_9]|nr:MAG: hypothetical protein A2039_03190 [Candidatus Melainabacteria bacterium GWA2_34_9]
MVAISIIMPSYNYADLITEAINSVIIQTYKDWELIIVDDGSKDNSLEVINQYVQKYPNIKLFTHNNNENKGLKETIKLGLEKCSGKYIAFLESDDYWKDDYLSKKIDIFNQNPDVKLVFNSVNLFGDEKLITDFKKRFKIHYKDIDEMNLSYFRPEDIAHYFMVMNMIASFSCTMIEKTALQECNFETPREAWLDWWLYTQIVFKHPIYYINEKLTYWRKHPDSYINSFTAEKRIRESTNFRISHLEFIKRFKGLEYNSILLKACLFKLLNKKINEFESCKDSFIESIKNKKVYLYGAGTFAEEVLEYCNAISLDIAGFIDGDKNKAQQKINKYTIFTKDDIATIRPDVIIISVKEWEPCYFELFEYLIQNNLNVPLVSNFFDEIRYKSPIPQNNQLSPEELFLLR